ncbi:MAG: hypothetical protein GXP42_06105 [Chloroflexi bacterium]|nr:hypothetical protein [Chloroflexota bacterium]
MNATNATNRSQSASSSPSRARNLQQRLETFTPRVRYALIFGVGMLIGLVLLGWVLFPVRWTNTYPRDLRPELRDDYLVMVADSYAIEGDLLKAAERMQWWPPEQWNRLLNLQAMRLEANNKHEAAARVRTLASDLSTALPPDLGGRVAAQSGALGLEFGRETVRIVLWVGLAVLALFALVALFPALRGLKASLQPRRARQTSLSPKPPRDVDVTDPAQAAVVSADAVPVLTPTPVSEEYEAFEEIEEEWQEPSAPIYEAPEEEEGAPTEAEAWFGLQPVTWVFDGDPDYSESEQISERDQYLGDFGFSVGEVARSEPHRVLTLEVWLFEKRDLRADAVTLMLPELYNDEIQREELKGKDARPMPLEPDKPLRLETQSMVLEGRIVNVIEGPQTDDGPSIASVTIHLRARPR